MSFELRHLISTRTLGHWKLAVFVWTLLASLLTVQAETKGRLHLRLRAGYTYDIYTSTQTRISNFTQSSLLATADFALLLGSTNYFEISNTTNFTLLPFR